MYFALTLAGSIMASSLYVATEVVKKANYIKETVGEISDMRERIDKQEKQVTGIKKNIVKNKKNIRINRAVSQSLYNKVSDNSRKIKKEKKQSRSRSKVISQK